MMRASLSLPSITLLRPVDIEVVMPGGFTTAAPPFKCLWALHCAMEDGRFFFDSLGLGELALKSQIAVVAPSLGNGYFMNSDYERQADFLQEMFRQLSTNFPISPLRADNAVLGISMGAFGALRWALQDNIFCSATLISGTFDCHIPLDERLFKNRRQRALHMSLEKTMRGMLLDRNGKTRDDADFEAILGQKKENFPQINFFCGDEDYLSLPQTLAISDICAKHGCPVNLNLGKGSHDPAYWRAVLPEAVSGIFDTTTLRQRSA